MFGTLRPPRCGALPVLQSYRRFYCGTCQGLGQHFGHTRRALLSHDAVFMAILADAVQARAAGASRCRCPMMPLTFRATLAPDSIAMRYAAALQMLLADQWLADRGADGQWSARALRSWFSEGPAREASAQLAALGVALPVLEGFEARQLTVERGGAARAEVAASPTAAVLAAAFETVAALPGASAAFAHEGGRLAELGAALGTAIYVLDALEDLERDARRRAFNPCLAPSGGISRVRTHEAIALLRAATMSAEDLCAALPWRRHGPLLRAVVRRFALRCRAAETGALSLLDVRPASGWRRAVSAASAAWAWGLSWTAHAAPTPNDVPPDVGSDALDVGGPDPAQDQLSEEPQRGCSACDGCGHAFGSGCDECFGGCGRWFVGCGDACTQCADCPNACGDATTGCCNDCGQGCDGCAHCGDGCGDGCNACGQGCGDCGQGCGDCGKGCGDCGQGCQGC